MVDGTVHNQSYEGLYLLVTQVERIGSRHFACVADIAAMFSRALCYAWKFGWRWKLPQALRNFGGRRMNGQLEGTTSNTGHPSRKTANPRALHRRLNNISALPVATAFLPSSSSSLYRTQFRCFEIRPRKLHPEHQPKTPLPHKSEDWLQHCASREEDSPSNANP
jgi:hypothetical protein